MDLNKDNIKKIILIIASGIAIYTAIHQFSMVWSALGWVLSIVFPFVLGACLAFIINVPMRCIERTLFGHYHGKREKLVKKLSRPISMTITILLVVGLIFVIVFMVVPQLSVTIGAINEQIPIFFSQIQQMVNEVTSHSQGIGEFLEKFNINIDWQNIGQQAINFVQGLVSGAFSSTMGVIMSIVSGVVTFFIAFVFGLYVLAQKESLSANVRKLFYAYLPEKKVDRLWEIGRLSNRTFSKFLSGQCLEALILGSMFLITMTIFRMPYALLVSIIVAFSALIPLIGAFIGCVLGALLILIKSPIMALWFVVMFLVLQQVEGNFIYPKVVGNSVGLPSIWVLAAVTIGGNLMGIAGIILFIPLCSVVYSVLRDMVWARLKQRKIPPEKVAVVADSDAYYKDKKNHSKK